MFSLHFLLFLSGPAPPLDQMAVYGDIGPLKYENTMLSVAHWRSMTRMKAIASSTSITSAPPAA